MDTLTRPRTIRGRYIRGTAFCFMMCVVLHAPAAPAVPEASVAEQPISAAEVMLFQTNHLNNIRLPVDLTYIYKKNNDSGPAVTDEAHLDVTTINPDGSVTASLRFLTGTRKLEIPEVRNSEGNPLILGFLEWDIAQMKQLTGGSTSYFRKRIRMALADTAQVRPVTFKYHGKQLAGQEITVQPYHDDPMHERFEKYVNKRYIFILSNQVAGGVYQLGTSALGTAKMDESFTLVKEENRKH